jgi:hypothetical protein
MMDMKEDGNKAANRSDANVYLGALKKYFIWLEGD